MLDLMVRGGKVVDGTGTAGRIADVGIADGRIVEIGHLSQRSRREIDAEGLLVTPGWLDLHTHYDGQATWDSQLDPSFSSGVTTALMGLCGVGFAPVADGMQTRLIELMEGVEEIPGTALHAGLKWNWRSFPDYLDVLEQLPRTFDIGALLPHGPLRLWAMGDEVGTNKCASGAELELMAGAVDEAMRAGAFGLATSRTANHRTSTGDMTPDYHVDALELEALTRPVRKHGGIFQVVPNGSAGEAPANLPSEMAMLEEIADRTGVNMHVLLFEGDRQPQDLAAQLTAIERMDGRRGRMHAQISGRSAGAFVSFLGSHPFLGRSTYEAITKLPLERWLPELSKAQVKARILSEKSGPAGQFYSDYLHRMYDLGPHIDFEPGPEQRVIEMAARQGRDPLELAYDLILQHSEHPRLNIAFTKYAHGNLDSTAALLMHPSTVLGVSDAGAHVTSVCDGTLHSFMLTHWGRDRRRGTLQPVEVLVHLMTQKSARAIGLSDRGVLAAGMKADINIIDHAALGISAPHFVADLPEGARRLMQQVKGYRATIVSGTITREFDQPTGALPGRLLRYNAGSSPLDARSTEKTGKNTRGRE